MTYDQIIDMTPTEFWSWFWQPFGVAQLVSIRDRLSDDLIIQLVQSDWIKSLSRFDQDWFWNCVDTILSEKDEVKL